MTIVVSWRGSVFAAGLFNNQGLPFGEPSLGSTRSEAIGDCVKRNRAAFQIAIRMEA